MSKLIYSMGVSLDGFIAGPDGKFGWSAPDEELHRFHNAQAAELGGHLCGRRLYEEMVYWETAERNPAAPDFALEFADIWKALPKVVFSKTLAQVEGNSRLATEGIPEEIAKLRRQTDKDLGVGGAGLAAALVRLGLVDEYRLFVSPVAVGGGSSFFPSLAEQVDLELIETKTFGSRTVYLRYSRA